MDSRVQEGIPWLIIRRPSSKPRALCRETAKPRQLPQAEFDAWRARFEFGDLLAALPRLRPPEGQTATGPDICLLQGGHNYLAHYRPQFDDIRAKLGKTDEQPLTRRVLKDTEGHLRQEVRALIARWLRMQNVCVLAGAGASRCCNAPLGSDFASGVATLLSGRPTSALFKRLLDACVQPVDFERFLSQLGAIRRCLRPSEGTFRQPLSVGVAGGAGVSLDVTALDALLKDIEAAIGILCNVQLPSDENGGAAHCEFVGKLLSRDPTLGRVKLATTNYDTLFEQAMDRRSVLYADGFTGIVDRHFSPGVFGLDYYYPGEVGEGRVRRYDKFLHLYKLHGSIRWRRSPISDSDPYGVTYCGRALPTLAEVESQSAELDDFFARGCSPSCTNAAGLAILPTSAKYGESIAMPYSHLFRAFAEALQEPQTVCLVVGYSGWDTHVNRLLQDALYNPSFTLVVVDPIVSAWTEALLRSDSCERVYALCGDKGKFEEFAKLMPDVEQLKTLAAVAKQQRELNATWPQPDA